LVRSIRLRIVKPHLHWNKTDQWLSRPVRSLRIPSQRSKILAKTGAPSRQWERLKLYSGDPTQGAILIAGELFKLIEILELKRFGACNPYRAIVITY
jgi:hypothetical protein